MKGFAAGYTPLLMPQGTGRVCEKGRKFLLEACDRGLANVGEEPLTFLFKQSSFRSARLLVVWGLPSNRKNAGLLVRSYSLRWHPCVLLRCAISCEPSRVGSRTYLAAGGSD